MGLKYPWCKKQTRWRLLHRSYIIVGKAQNQGLSKQEHKLPLRFDVDRPRDDEDLRHKYAVDTENRFQVLCEAITEETIPNELWTSMEDSYKDSAKEIVGFVKKKRRKCWIKEETITTCRRTSPGKSSVEHQSTTRTRQTSTATTPSG